MARYLITFCLLCLIHFCSAQQARGVAGILGLDVAFSQGVSIVDINEDGFDDVFITRRTRDNQFFLNNGDGSFTNIAPDAGVDDVGRSALTIWDDFDQDGDQDFFLGMEEGASKLYRNNGDLTFTNVSDKLGNIEGFIASAQWGDVNGDGWSDLFIFRLDGDNRFFFSNRAGGFDEVTESLDLIQKRLTMGAVLLDFDQDYDLDLYMTHDGFEGNHFFVNDGSGNFEDKSIELGIYTETDAMGIAVADFDNDGWEDIYLTNLYENQLFKNNQGLGFEEIGANAGVDDYGMGWGTSWIDYDNNGWLDLYLANDSYFSDYNNVLYRNLENGTFGKIGVEEVIASAKASYATAVADLNNDGIQELLLANRGAVDRFEVFEFINERSNNWLSVKLDVQLGESLIGARIVMTKGGSSWTRTVQSGMSWSGESSDWLHFGLNDADEVNLELTYADGEQYEYIEVSANQHIVLNNETITNTKKAVFEIAGDVITSTDINETKYINTYINKYIYINIYNNVKINILNYEGVLMYEDTFQSLGELDLSFLDRGHYVLQIITKAETKVLRIFKE